MATHSSQFGMNRAGRSWPRSRRWGRLPRGGTGCVFGLAPADFKEEVPNTEQAAVEWLPGVGRSIPLSRWMNPSSLICETAAAAGALDCLAKACEDGLLNPGSVMLYSNNKGMIQVLQGLSGRKHSAWWKTVGVGWWGMIRRATEALVSRGGTWRSH
jgi:hypothetical protein